LAGREQKREALTWLRRVQDEVRGEWARKPLSGWLEHYVTIKKPNLQPASYIW
jgi:hypothetical protein